VRFKDNGLQLVEVVDNGTGISEEDFTKIGLRYYTSKISSFEDLGQVQTLGFRGEAISSLCAVANLVVLTATAATAPRGSKLSFDTAGVLSHRATIARQPGTTCQVTDLFKPFPVRHREFLRNAKREFGKAVQLMYAYALTTQPIRLKLTSTDSKGKTTQVFSTTGSKDLLANFTSLFGSIASLNLQPFSFSLLSDAYHVHGLISKFQAGSGRGTADRQFFFINNRPCQLVKVSKVFNEVYRAQFPNQLPTLVVHLNLPHDEYDVNLTPDKRTLLLHREAELIQSLRTSLIQLFESSKATIPLNSSLKDHFEASPARPAFPMLPQLSPPASSKNPLTVTLDTSSLPTSNHPSTQSALPNSLAWPAVNKPPDRPALLARPSELNTSPSDFFRTPEKLKEEMSPEVCFNTSLKRPRPAVHHESEIIPYDPASYLNVPEEEYSLQSNPPLESGMVLEWEWIMKADPTLPSSPEAVIPLTMGAHYSNPDNSQAERALVCQLNPKVHFNQMCVVGQFNLGFIIVILGPQLFIVDQHAADEIYNYTRLHQATPTSLARQPLINPLSLHLAVADELVVIDNLERLKSQGYDFTIIPSNPPGQRLRLISLPLAGSVTFDPHDLDRLIHNLSVHPTLGCSLTARGGKLDAKLASQACRRSVMIGDPLDYATMTRIVRNLANLPRPWNCPHGRPTIRHLTTL
ncbi:ATP-binding mismatch repair protein, partial [Massospora cicadina]